MDYIVAGIIILILALSIIYIVRAKKRGVKCIGCSVDGSCPKHCSGHCHDTKDSDTPNT